MKNPNTDRESDVVPTEHHSASLLPNDFIPLIQAVMTRQRIKPYELASKAGYSKQKISGILTGARSIDNMTLFVLFDSMRALLAMTHYDDCERYFDPDIEIVANLIEALPSALNKARSECDRVPISMTGATVLAQRLAEMIANNDRETEKRRREMPIAGL
jgi:hypothetical protein